MAAGIVYTYFYIGPGFTNTLFIHGYADNQAVNYSAVLGDCVPFGDILCQANVTPGDVFRHVDGTVARTVYIRNIGQACSLKILHTVEGF